MHRTVRLETPGHEIAHPAQEMYFSMDDCGDLPPLPLMDNYLNSMLMIAMHRGLELKMRGPVSRKAVINAYEFQDAWLKWLPNKFTRVDIDADQVVDDYVRPTEERAVQAFSGGLDAVFTAWYHKLGGPRLARKNLDRAVFVHGFDIGLSDKTGFEGAVAKARIVLDAVDMSLTTMRTNMRSVARVPWEIYHGAALGCILGQFAPTYTQGLIGSSPSYEALFTPWGSNPMTDPLGSGAMMDIFHDGAGYSRPDKIGGVGQWSVAAANMRVCWRSADKSVNCGVCEKCVRTALGFKANGYPIPPSLNQDLSVKDIRAIRCGNDIQMKQLVDVYRLAKRNGQEGSWLWALWKIIDDYKRRRGQIGEEVTAGFEGDEYSTFGDDGPLIDENGEPVAEAPVEVTTSAPSPEAASPAPVADSPSGSALTMVGNATPKPELARDNGNDAARPASVMHRPSSPRRPTSDGPERRRA